jgi:hypothetical protein
MKALIVGSYIQRRLEVAGYKNYIRPVDNDLQLTGIAAIKVVWERVLEEYVDRKIEYFWKNGKPYMHDERRLRRGLMLDGPMLQQVDPFRLLIDLEAGQTKDCAFIGDESDQFIHVLNQKAEIGLFSQTQLDKLSQHYPGSEQIHEPNYHDILRRSRSITSNWDAPRYAMQHRGARRVKTTDLWAFYDFRDGYDGITHPDGRKVTGVQRVVGTVAGRLVLQLRLNPFDKKFPPYGVGRLNPNGHEMISVAPFDHVVGSNAQYDRYMSAVLRHAELSVDPIIVTSSQDTNLPDTMLGVRAGKIFRCPGDFKEVRIGDLPSSFPVMRQHFRGEAEELSGALRVFEVPEGANTATEVERKIQEQNRLLRPDIRANADLWRQIGLIIYWMSGQFSTQVERFKVVGKASKMLGHYAEVAPDMLQDDIDLRFLGAESLQTHSQKGNGLIQWFNLAGPFLPAMPDVSVENALMMSFEHLVGPEYVDRIFKGQTPEWMQWSQEDENFLLLRGQEISVNDTDDDQDHLSDMGKRGMMKLAAQKDTPVPVANAILAHWFAHKAALEKKQQAQKQQMLQAQRQGMLTQMAQNGPQPLPPAQGGGGNGSSPPEGKPAPPGGMEAKSQGPGVTNGPPQNRTVARTGRSGAGISQTQQMGTGSGPRNQ